MNWFNLVMVLLPFIVLYNFMHNPRVRAEEEREENEKRIRAEKARKIEDKKSSYYQNQFIGSVYEEIRKESQK